MRGHPVWTTDIENKKGIGIMHGEVEARIPISRDIERIALFFKTFADELGEIDIVFNE
jgi:hypothetical protein